MFAGIPDTICKLLGISDNILDAITPEINFTNVELIFWFADSSKISNLIFQNAHATGQFEGIAFWNSSAEKRYKGI